MKSDHDYRDYWNNNIDRWGELYLDISHGHETLAGPAWLASLYRATVGKLEARLMRERFRRTMWFVQQYAYKGQRFADIGCGTGIFTVAALKAGAEVIAIDFSQKALEVTRANVEKHAPSGRVTYLVMDAQRQQIPECDAALVMGVTPYVADLPAFLGNILPRTKMLYCQYTDPWRPSNVVRRLLPFLNVRRLIFHSGADVDRIYRAHGFHLVKRAPFATGFIDLAAVPGEGGGLGGIFSA